MILLVTICVILAYILSVLWSRRRIYGLHQKLKNETWALPVIGNYLLFIGSDEVRMDMLKRFGRIAIKQGGMTSLWIGPKLSIVVSDANVAQIMLKSCLAKGDAMKVAHELFGNGSIFGPVHIWRPRRKVIAPTFSIKNLNQFMEVFYRQSSIMVEQLKGAAGTGTFSVWKYLTTYTMDSVCESTLGVKVNAQRQPNHPFLQAFDKHCQMGAARLIQPPIAQKAYKYLPVYKTYLEHIHCMWNFVDNIVKEKRKELAGKEVKTQEFDYSETKETSLQLKTFLELFIETSGGALGFTNLELREETLVLLLAGTDTSAVGSAFTCLMLARHPDVQEKVYKEIKEVLGESGRPITSTDLPNLKYLDAVLKESMRLYPPVPIITRKVLEDLLLPSGLTIVKGTDLMINIWAIHRNPQYWGLDAEEFRPDRFIGSSLSHPAAFMAFSHGPRACLGYQYAMMSMKTAMANLIRHYRIQPSSPVRDKNAPLRVRFDVMMKHVDNFELQIEKRT